MALFSTQILRFTTAISVILSATIVSATDSVDPTKEVRIRNQQDRLASLEKLVERRKIEIENDYARKLAEIRDAAEMQAARLVASERELWQVFFRMNWQIPYADTYNLATNRTYLHDRNAYKLREQLIRRYFLTQTRDSLLDKKTRTLLKEIVENRFIPQQVRLKARRILTLATDFQEQAKRLKINQQDALNSLKALKQSTVLHAKNTIDQIKNISPTSSTCVVNAINYAPGNNFAMIDGKIFRKGQSINNVKISRINRYSVEFSENGRKWTQKVNLGL